MRAKTARSRRDRRVAVAMTWAASGQPRCGAGTRLFRSVWLWGVWWKKGGTRWVADTHLLLSGRRACRSRRGPCRGLPRGGYAGEGARRPACCGIGVGTSGRVASAAIGTRGRRAGLRSALTHSAPRTDWETARKARVRAPREAFKAGVRFGTCAGHSPAVTAAAAGRGRQGIVVVSPVTGHDDGASKSCAVVSPLECGMPYGACGRVT